MQNTSSRRRRLSRRLTLTRVRKPAPALPLLGKAGTTLSIGSLELPSSAMQWVDVSTSFPKNGTPPEIRPDVGEHSACTWQTYLLPYYSARCKEIIALRTNRALVISGSTWCHISEDAKSFRARAQLFSTSATVNEPAGASKNLNAQSRLWADAGRLQVEPSARISYRSRHN